MNEKEKEKLMKLLEKEEGYIVVVLNEVRAQLNTKLPRDKDKLLSMMICTGHEVQHMARFLKRSYKWNEK